MNFGSTPIAARAAIATVWVANGLAAKALGLVPRHQAIVERILGVDDGWVRWIAVAVAAITGWFAVASLAATYWTYDRSNLYALDWLDVIALAAGGLVVLLDAGYDETSTDLARRLPGVEVRRFDFSG